MQYDKELIAHKLDRWDRFITDYHLPEWDSIPDLGLYMDQVVVLLAQYLNFIPAMPGGKESFVTSSTINNYVRLKIMPAPVKRKYFRVHIAYLIMILTMKQSISISDVQKIIPADIPEEEVRATYQEYSEKFRHIALFFNQQVQDAAEDIRTPDQPGEAAVSRLVIESALIAGFSKILAEKLIRLCGADTQEVLAAEKPPRLTASSAPVPSWPTSSGSFLSPAVRRGTFAVEKHHKNGTCAIFPPLRGGTKRYARSSSFSPARKISPAPTVRIRSPGRARPAKVSVTLSRVEQ